MGLKNTSYIGFKTIVTIILICIGFLGIIRSLGMFYSIGKISIPPLIHALTLGIFITSCLFMAMAVCHNFNPVSKLLKASLASFSILILPPCLFSLIMTIAHGSWVFSVPFLILCSAFMFPMALILLSNKLTYRRSAKAA